MAEITFQNVWKRYPDGFEAVKDMNLEIGDGEFMILVGPSGCGKSTALRMVAGLEDITDGELIIGGERVNELAPRDRDIAMVFQNYALYPHMTVRENMGFALKLAKVDQARDRRRRSTRRREILELGAHLERKPANLSGGQRQRVAMGRAIVRDPQGVPDGRAAVEPGRQAARADAHPGRADPAAARHDDALRHPRPDRGDDARRPRRGDARRDHPAGRHAEGALRRPDQPVRGRLHRLAGDELHPRAPGGGQGPAAVRRRADPRRRRRRASAT